MGRLCRGAFPGSWPIEPGFNSVDGAPIALQSLVDQRIDSLQRECAADPSIVSLAGGLPACKLFPKAALAASASRVVRRDGNRALQYDWPEGREELRAWICARLARRGARVSPEEVIITSGAQQAVSIATHVLLGGEGSEGRAGSRHGRAPSVALDPETYPGALDIFRARGAVAQSIEGARCAYVMPALSNPRGRVMPPPERAAWLDWARRTGGHLIEDDAYAELVFRGEPEPPLLAQDRAHVWHTGTFSKTLCPGMRVGWLVPPPSRRAQALERKRLVDLQSNGLTQSILEDFLARDDFDRRLATARRHYERKAEALACALRRHLPEAEFEEPAGGFSIWARLPDGGDDAELLAEAARHGVSFDPGSMFRSRDPRGGPAPLELRLCYSLEPADKLEEGVRRLARAWRGLTRRARAAPARRTPRALERAVAIE
jgi:2-aminoadipate transaminase